MYSRKKKDADDPRDEIKCSCGLCFGIGGAITIGAAMVIILILYLACMLEVNYFLFRNLPLKFLYFNLNFLGVKCFILCKHFNFRARINQVVVISRNRQLVFQSIYSMQQAPSKHLPKSSSHLQLRFHQLNNNFKDITSAA